MTASFNLDLHPVILLYGLFVQSNESVLLGSVVCAIVYINAQYNCLLLQHTSHMNNFIVRPTYLGLSKMFRLVGHK